MTAQVVVTAGYIAMDDGSQIELGDVAGELARLRQLSRSAIDRLKHAGVRHDDLLAQLTSTRSSAKTSDEAVGSSGPYVHGILQRDEVCSDPLQFWFDLESNRLAKVNVLPIDGPSRSATSTESKAFHQWLTEEGDDVLDHPANWSCSVVTSLN